MDSPLDSKDDSDSDGFEVILSPDNHDDYSTCDEIPRHPNCVNIIEEVDLNSEKIASIGCAGTNSQDDFDYSGKGKP